MEGKKAAYICRTQGVLNVWQGNKDRVGPSLSERHSVSATI